MRVSLILFRIFAVILPLMKMLSTMAGINVLAVMSTRKFMRALPQSFYVSSTAAVIPVLIALILAFSTAQTRSKHKTIINTLLSTPMLIPSISHGMGLIIIFGANGWLSVMLGLNGGIFCNQ